MTHCELVSAVADMAAENERLRAQLAQVERANVALQERIGRMAQEPEPPSSIGSREVNKLRPEGVPSCRPSPMAQEPGRIDMMPT